MVIVADSSPLIAFAILERLDLLERIFSELYVPQAVFDEVLFPGKNFAKPLSSFLKGRIRPVKDLLAVKVLQQQVDRGEAEAITLALENNIKDILLDDYRGRQVAEASGLYPIGTIGVLIQAKKSGMVAEVKPLLDQLMAHEIRISKNLYQKALSLADERE